MWLSIIRLLEKKDKIIELGCGYGELSKMLIYSDFEYIKGYDNNRNKINNCKNNLHDKYSDRFILENIYDEDIYNQDYSTVICCDVLDYIEDELEIRENIKSGTKIIFTIKKYKNSREIRERYKGLVEFQLIKEEKVNVFLINCTRL